MLVAAVAVKALPAHQIMVALEERVEAVQALIVQPQHPELQTQVVEVVAVVIHQRLTGLAAQAAQASSSFPTQAQHNYSVVELLPNQAVTSFTRLHLLAHLALCHL